MRLRSTDVNIISTHCKSPYVCVYISIILLMITIIGPHKKKKGNIYIYIWFACLYFYIYIINTLIFDHSSHYILYIVVANLIVTINFLFYITIYIAIFKNTLVYIYISFY